MAKVLVIDDSEDFREMVSALLIDAGYEVELAENVEIAREKCEAQKFDLIMCDLVLPIQEEEPDEEVIESAIMGVHAIQQFAAKYPEIPVIAVSGQMTGAPLQAMVRFGAKGCLSKPFSRDQLLNTVKAVI